MSHMIEGNNMFSVKLEPWHKLGIILDEPPTSAEAIKAAGMDWQVQTRNLFWKTPAGHLAAIPNRVALVRSTDEKLLSVVSDGYKPLQNVEAFEWFDPLVEAKMASYETAGVLCEGRKVWVLAKLAQQIIVGEDYKDYVLLTNGHDGATAVSISAVRERVVCNNTLHIALSEGGRHLFSHTGDVAAKLEVAKQALGLVIKHLDTQKEGMEYLATKQLAGPEAFLDELLNIEMPEIDETTLEKDEVIEAGTYYQRRMKNGIMALFSGDGTGLETIQGTKYAMLNAVTEFVDHYAGARSKDRAYYTLMGPGNDLKDRAFELLADSRF
jgi:phage/plasmid-like protein (TIGR03299 family)